MVKGLKALDGVDAYLNHVVRASQGHGSFTHLRNFNTKEARNTPFCPSQEELHTVVSRGVGNVSEAP